MSFDLKYFFMSEKSEFTRRNSVLQALKLFVLKNYLSDFKFKK